MKIAAFPRRLMLAASTVLIISGAPHITKAQQKNSHPDLIKKTSSVKKEAKPPKTNSSDNAPVTKPGICGCWDSDFFMLPKCAKLSETETIREMECLLEQKGNKRNFKGGTATHNGVSQVFGPSPMEVIALFNISYLFHGNEDFASARVLLYDNQDDRDRRNAQEAIDIAYIAYSNWLIRVKGLGLEEARKQKLDPFADSIVSWY